MVLLPTLFPGSTLLLGPKHSTSVSSSAGSAVALSTDVKGPLVPKPLSDIAVKGWLAPLGIQMTVPFDRCDRIHRLLLPATLQKVFPLPVTVHLKVKVSSLGQVGGGGMICPATSPEIKYASSG